MEDNLEEATKEKKKRVKKVIHKRVNKKGSEVEELKNELTNLKCSSSESSSHSAPRIIIEESRSQPESRRGSILPSETSRRDSDMGHAGSMSDTRRRSSVMSDTALSGVLEVKDKINKAGSPRDEEISSKKMKNIMAMMMKPSRNIQKAYTWDDVKSNDSDANKRWGG